MVANYGVLRGQIIDSIPYKSGADHFQIEVKADQNYRIAVDVYSQITGHVRRYAPHGENLTLDTDREVMYFKDENYTHSITTKILANVKTGFTAKADLDPDLYLDYVRYTPSLFPLDSMKVVAPKSAGNDGDNLNDDIGPWVTKATNNPNAEVFAFGSGWDDNAAGGEPDTRPYFSPDPSVGIHDIHMNQGDTGQQAKYNGISQDGALFIYFSDTNTWVAMFFRFQNQSTNTDDNGNVK
ncbi:YukJ family protein [Mucilaginibacter sp. X4EP1]|uniref:YukJ family protein n=1 Tax=Mucilaginibacter sp. X4EP1 TaxID=2723092 RepID=UPI0021674762|nr:YukJ family protein [Mucilaginibacter sp. X4EP1]MCS3812754.1 uncharacterized protein YukJ [Mucilaginibacter sp. X4EP1]